MDGIFTTRFVDPYLRFHKWVYEWSDGRVGCLLYTSDAADE